MLATLGIDKLRPEIGERVGRICRFLETTAVALFGMACLAAADRA